MSRSSHNYRKLLTALLAAALLLVWLCVPALASSVIDPAQKGSVTVNLICDGQKLSGGEFSLYHVATIGPSAALHYDLTDAFAGAGVDLDEAEKAEEQIAAAAILSGLTAGVTPTAVLKTDQEGTAAVEGLELGVYLVVQTTGPAQYTLSSPFLAFVPITGEAGSAWVYQVTAAPKVQHIYYPNTTTKTQVTVTKEWNDAGYENQRPSSVQVTLVRDGEVYGQPVTLSDDNAWSHTWSNLSDQFIWSVDEVDVPDGYSAFVSGSGGAFTITNTYTDETVPLSSAFGVEKVWADGNDSAGARPDQISVTLYANGTPYDTVALNEDNGWSYTWAGMDTTTTWTVAEDSVPDGYTASVRQEEGGFVITNTYQTDAMTDIEDDAVPLSGGPNAPQTGLVQWPIPVLMTVGAVLLGLAVLPGRTRKRNR